MSADVDAAVVVAVDQHRVLVRPAGVAVVEAVRQHVAVEAHERGAVLGLDDGQHVGVDVGDHARGVARGLLVERLALELQPADPVAAAVGDDLHLARPAAAQQLAAAAAQDDPAALVAARQPERGRPGAGSPA